MRKLLIVGMIILGCSTYAQNKLNEKLMFENVFKSLERRTFTMADFADTVKMFVIYRNELAYTRFDSKSLIVSDLNNILIFMFKYDHFKLSSAKSKEDTGFIVDLNFLDEKKNIYRKNQIYIVLNKESKISIILIK